MNTTITTGLGIASLVLSFSTVFLMFHLWGYPFDKATRTSAAPKGLMILHRILGYLYFAVYVAMMVMMVPRMWTYQVEFPPRTVAHIILALTIGVVLIIKLSIIRFFRHLEEWMPYLGTLLLLCTVLLLGLSLPFTFKERHFANKVVGGNVYSAQNLERMKKVLPEAGFPKEAPVDKLSSVESLKAGRRVLLSECVQCHDLKTILVRPRAPQDWVQTVTRMADKPTLTKEITEEEQYQVAAYLIAISPDLQASAAKKRAMDMEMKKAQLAARATLKKDSPGDDKFDEAAAKKLMGDKCTQCHELDELEKKPPKTKKAVDALLSRMVDNGLECEDKELKLIALHLRKTYAKGGDDAEKPKPADSESDE
jgi:mono/diheme cytochrome c family protein